MTHETINLLERMIQLAEQRKPVQGRFFFGTWNEALNDCLRTREGIPNCGTMGCLAGGYLPLIDPERFYFREDSEFMDGRYPFAGSTLYEEMGEEYFDAMFCSWNQVRIGLPDLRYNAPIEDVISNAKQVLAMMKKEMNNEA